ncbi:MAG TPA: Gfo/Idh/MocA family oxidoreductase [Burkholderiales bacterium]|nr:Gfo/Idh/MocA family oxidoreductase [Burkholderiales bacterium]
MHTLRAAVIGVGSLGRYHAQKYAALDGVELHAVADLDAARATAVAAELGCRGVTDYRELLPDVDLVSVVVPTEAHCAVASACLEAGAHVLVEKPIARTLEEADALIALAARRSRTLAVGHLERFNPAFADLDGMLDRPFFMEAERLGGFKGRGTDVDVVLDLMIHDIDLMLAVMPSKVVSVSSCGFRVLTDLVDIANARFEFEDGAVADLSASRVSRTPVRKLRVFGPNFYASADLQLPELRVERKPGPDGEAATARTYDKPDALKSEIGAFVAAVRGEPASIVSGTAGRDALALALEVNAGIHERLERLSRRAARP